MSMKPQELQPIPEATRRVANKAFPKGTLAMRLRDALGPIYQDEAFVDLFAKRGRPGVQPWRLALVTVLQHLEQLTDRQAAQAVAGRLDWKYALSLSLEDEGFDPSVLSDFRQKLSQQDAAMLLLEPVLRICRQRGWLSSTSEQRTDSTHIVASVRRLSSVESVGETMRWVLNTLSEEAPDWLLSVVDPQWWERYVDRFELARLPKSEAQRAALRQQVGEDSSRLLELARATEAPSSVQKHACVQLLQQVWSQHYQIVQGQITWRDGPAVRNEHRLVSPYDQQARASRKRETQWLGYKVHLTETCAPEEPVHLLLQVHTTLATTQDVVMSETILQEARDHGQAPQQWYVDQGYTSGQLLATQAEKGTEVIGPVALTPGWQSQQAGAYPASAFELLWSEQQAICPQGKRSSSWRESTDARGRQVLQIHFGQQDCQSCPLRVHCTKGERRSLTVLPQAAQQARRERREQQREEPFQKRYRRRAGVEGTISQAVRRTGIRRCRSRGLAKVRLQHLCSATAINLVRLDAMLVSERTGKPARGRRPRSPFSRLQDRWVA